jgi:hypothetical protein
MTENERCHLGIPETGLMSKMDASFQHFAHCYCHDLLQRLVLKSSPFIDELRMNQAANTLTGQICDLICK